MKSKVIFNILRGVIGVTLLPVLFAIFVCDRVLLVALPHVQAPTILEVLADVKKFVPSLIRVFTVAFLAAFYFIITQMI